MTPRDALREVIREAAQAGIEYAADELRGHDGRYIQDVIKHQWAAEIKHQWAAEIADLINETPACRILLALVERAERNEQERTNA